MSNKYGEYLWVEDYDFGKICLIDNIPARCRHCGWKESGRCYNEKIAVVTKCVGMGDQNYIEWAAPQIQKGDLQAFLEFSAFGQRGQLITLDLFKKCCAYHEAKQHQKDMDEWNNPKPVEPAVIPEEDDEDEDYYDEDGDYYYDEKDIGI